MLAVEPLPSWPNSFEPQQSTEPVLFSAHVCATPAAMVVPQVIATLTLALATFPLAFVPTAQVCPAGCVWTVTA
jgi:hypothetical protein